MLRNALSACIGLCFISHPFCADIQDINPYQVLHEKISRIVDKIDPKYSVGIEIISLQDHHVIYEKNATEKLIPASSVKLLTAAAILNQLGPSYSFETKLLTDGKLQGQQLIGNLYLQGAGDPSLKGHSLEALIFQLKLAGVKEVIGDIIIDSTEFDELTLAPGWMWDAKMEYRNSPVEALTINHSCIKIWIKPSLDVQLSPVVSVQPEIPGLIVKNQAKVKPINSLSNSITISKTQQEGCDEISIAGDISDKSDVLKFKIPVKNPHLYAATEFCERLHNNGILYKGKIRFESTPEKVKTVAVHLSEPLFKLVMYMIKNSDDLYANCFLKKLGRVKYGKPGTWPNGCQSVKEFLSSIDQQIFSTITLLDGSGESNCNRVSAHQMIRFLTWASKEFLYSPEFIAAFPLSGIDKALQKRMQDRFLKAKIRASVGALAGVSSLSGFAVTMDGDPLAFSIMLNGVKQPLSKVKAEIEDQICELLVHFSKNSKYNLSCLEECN